MKILTLSPCKGESFYVSDTSSSTPPSSILSIPNRLLQRSLQTVLSCRIISECDNNHGDILLAAPHRGYQDYPGRLCRSISSITPLLDVSPSSPTPKLVTLLRYSIRS